MKKLFKIAAILLVSSVACNQGSQSIKKQGIVKNLSPRKEALPPFILAGYIGVTIAALEERCLSPEGFVLQNDRYVCKNFNHPDALLDGSVIVVEVEDNPRKTVRMITIPLYFDDKAQSITQIRAWIGQTCEIRDIANNVNFHYCGERETVLTRHSGDYFHLGFIQLY